MTTTPHDPADIARFIEQLDTIADFIRASAEHELEGRPHGLMQEILHNPLKEGEKLASRASAYREQYPSVNTEKIRSRNISSLLGRLSELNPAPFPGWIRKNPPSAHEWVSNQPSDEPDIDAWEIKNPDSPDEAVCLPIQRGTREDGPDGMNVEICWGRGEWKDWATPALRTKINARTPELCPTETLDKDRFHIVADCAGGFLRGWQAKIKALGVVNLNQAVQVDLATSAAAQQDLPQPYSACEDAPSSQSKDAKKQDELEGKIQREQRKALFNEFNRMLTEGRESGQRLSKCDLLDRLLVSHGDELTSDARAALEVLLVPHGFPEKNQGDRVSLRTRFQWNKKNCVYPFWHNFTVQMTRPDESNEGVEEQFHAVAGSPQCPPK